VRVHCHIDKEDIHLLPGMYLKAIVETGEAQVPALPDEAIMDFEGQKYIFIATEKEHMAEADSTSEQGDLQAHKFKMIQIQIGNNDMGYTEVGLPQGIEKSKIVVKGAYVLLSKLKNSEELEDH
jgi:cobalt-zinc-cadmium efflux system membrane fusion protein